MNNLGTIKYKSLHLENVICESVSNIKIEEVNKYIISFLNRLELLKIKTTSGLITRLSGSEILENGEIRASYDFLIEIDGEYDEYTKLTEYRIDSCLFLHYDGEPQFFELAHVKLQLYLFEHELVNDGTIYTHMHSQKDNRLIADLYVPITEA